MIPFARTTNAFRIFAILLLYSAGSLSTSTLAQQNEVLKANHLASFVDFVRWETARDEVTVIAVIGAPLVVGHLKTVAATKRENGKELNIREISVSDNINGVDIIYFGLGQKNAWSSLISASKKLSILTVGEESGFRQAGGLIEFVVTQNRLRFSLNLETAHEYKLELSSKLAQLSIN